MTAPKVCILLLTYTDKLTGPRAKYAEKTLRSTLDNLRYDAPVSVHVADDGSPEKHVQKLMEIAGGYPNVQGVTSTNAARRGYGASYNLATQVVHDFADIVLPLEDDWELVQELSIQPFVEALTAGPIRCIRLGYVGWTDQLKGELGVSQGNNYLLFDPESREQHVCAGHPRLETVEFERAVGPWPEGLDPGTTERVWCGFKGARVGVAWPTVWPLNAGPFSHIGTIQAREDQVPAEAVA